MVPHVPSGRVTLVRVSGFQVLVVIGGVSFGSSLSYRQPPTESGRGWTVLELDLLPLVLVIGCDRFQDAQQFITIAGTIEQCRCNFKSHE